MYRFLGQKGYSEEFLDSSGLFSSRYKGMPLFSGRLMFPISDRQGRVVAFGGRALPGAPVLGGREAPKYINSPELETYKKGQTLFAIDLALPEIRRTKEVYIAEGYMDVIALHQGGISNAVAPLGTAFTEDQAKLLRRWAERVVLVFDSDKAGQEAAYKGILTCRRNGLSCVLAVPGTGLEDQEAALKQEGGVEAQNLKDPADILKNLGSEALHKSMKCFINDFEYLISRGRSQYDVSTPVGKNRALALLFPYLELLDSEIERDDCIGAAADALRVDRTAVLDDYKRRHTGGTAAREEVPKSGAPVQMNAELRLLTAVSVNQNLYPVFRTELEIKEIEDPAAKELFVALEECFIHEENGMEALLTRLSSESLRNYIADRGVSREFTNNPGQFIADGVKMVKTKRKFERRSSEIMAKIREMERNSDSLSDNSSLEDLLSEKMHIDAEIRKLEGR
jgi:DNA primase